MPKRSNRILSVAVVALAPVVLIVATEGHARACGGCFVSPSEKSVVTDHRMAFSVSPEQTVLWDQIRYSGDPREFAWVLPVHPGARVELSHDEWFAALDAATQPVIQGPATGYGGAGCGIGGCGNSASDSAASPAGGQVQIVRQAVVGPYETVTLRATDPNALTDWLREHAFDIPSSIQPTLDEYVAEGFDFIALRLRPVCSERAMKPVRIVTPGADPSLPLRMVAAGVGANVGITLYVISEGRYRPQNFPETTLNDAQLTWDQNVARSNYEELSQATMAQNGGRTWLTEFAGPVSVTHTGYGSPSPYANTYYGNPGLGDAYYGLCDVTQATGGPSPGVSGTPCDRSSDDPDASTAAGGSTGANVYDPIPPDASSDGAADASSDGAANGDAGDGAPPLDAGHPADAGRPPTTGTDGGGSSSGDAGAEGDACSAYDDLTLATTGLHGGDVWVTRLRAVLPADALHNGDLKLEAAPTQTAVSNLHFASRYADGSTVPTARTSSNDGCASAPRRHDTFGSLVLLGMTFLGIGSILRRRR